MVFSKFSLLFFYSTLLLLDLELRHYTKHKSYVRLSVLYTFASVLERLARHILNSV